MKALDLIVAVENCCEAFPDNLDVTIEIEDGMYETLVAFAQECYDNETEFTEEMLEEKFPDIYQYINKAVDEYIPGAINLDEDEDIGEYSWYVEYPDDICEMLLDI